MGPDGGPGDIGTEAVGRSIGAEGAGNGIAADVEGIFAATGSCTGGGVRRSAASASRAILIALRTAEDMADSPVPVLSSDVRDRMESEDGRK